MVGRDPDGSERAVEFERLVGERRSIRGFLPQEIPLALLQRVLQVAQQAPSNCNVQPWVVHVVTGDATRRMRAALLDAVRTEEPLSPDIVLTPPYPDAYRARQISAAKALFTASGVRREDVEARRLSFERNFHFFDAPCAAFFFLPDWAGMREAADCGMYVQTLMLAFVAHGLASCPQGALSHYAGVVRRELKVPEQLRLLFGLSFGYEDPSAPANQTRTGRASLSESVAIH